jgi:nucleotide-binding universal stress UspA family protein
MYRTLLVPLDGSPFGEAALPLAAALAQATGAGLSLCLVHDPSAYIRFSPGDVAIPPHDSGFMQQVVAEQRAYLDDVVARCVAAGVPATAAWLEGTVVEAIHERAQVLGADLIVLSTHGRGGLARVWIGSVATSLIGRATLPILLVRPAEGAAPAAGAPIDATAARAAFGAPVLVTLDGSPFAEQVLEHARTLAAAMGSPLELFLAVEPGSVRLAPFGAEALLADESALLQEERDAAEYLERVARRFDIPTATRSVTTDMSPARAIIERVAASPHAAVALATHGRSGLSRLLLGSVADKLLRTIDRPLLVYRPSGPSTQ